MNETCPKCGGKMIRGFLADRTDSALLKQTWIEGEKPSKLVQKKGTELTAYACEMCGYIELYLDKE